MRQITELKKSEEGLVYFIYQNRAMVFDYIGPDTLVWPEKIENLTVNLLTKDLHQLFEKKDEIFITFPASMIGFDFNISYEWNDWENDNSSVVSLNHVDWGEHVFEGKLVLEGSGTANVLLIAGDAEDPPHEHLYHITVEKAADTNIGQREDKPGNNKPGGNSGNSNSGSNTSHQTDKNQGNKTEEIPEATTETVETETESEAAASDTETVETVDTKAEDAAPDTPEEEAASQEAASAEDDIAPQAERSGMSTTMKTLVGGISGLVLLQIVLGFVMYRKKCK